MGDRTPWDEKIIEALEACRSEEPAGDDPLLARGMEALATDAQLREHFAQVWRSDARLARAIQDVPVPEGLGGRILDRLRQDRGDSQEGESAPRPRRRSRRWMMGSVAVGAIGVAVLLVVILTGPRGDPVSPGAIQGAAIERFLSEMGTPLDGALIEQTQPPDRFPFSRDIASARTVRWRHVVAFLGRKGVAYDLALPTGARATLYVVRGHGTGLGSVPPIRPRAATQDISIGVWESEGLLYVLVVQGGERAYRGLLNVPQGPLA